MLTLKDMDFQAQTFMMVGLGEKATETADKCRNIREDEYMADSFG